MQMNLWDRDADLIMDNNEVLLLKNARVSRYGASTSIDKFFGTAMIVNPSLPEADALRLTIENKFQRKYKSSTDKN